MIHHYNAINTRYVINVILLIEYYSRWLDLILVTQIYSLLSVSISSTTSFVTS